MRNTTQRFGVVLGALLALGAGCKDVKQEAARTSEQQVRTHVSGAQQATARLLQGFNPLLEQLAQPMGALVGQPADLRVELINTRSRQTSAGALTLFPVSFVAVVGRDGVCIARNIEEAEDRMRGLNLGTLFPPVQTALGGTAATGIGTLPPVAAPAPDPHPAPGARPVTGLPERVFFAGAVPLRDASGAVVGALVSGMNFTAIAHAVHQAVVNAAGQQPVLWAGLRRQGRVFPSEIDTDVAERWRVPTVLVRAIPADVDARVQSGNGAASWNFIENNQRGWGAVVARLEALEGTQLVLFRSEARQY